MKTLKNKFAVYIFLILWKKELIDTKNIKISSMDSLLGVLENYYDDEKRINFNI